jgi:hypothetical protein
MNKLHKNKILLTGLGIVVLVVVVIVGLLIFTKPSGSQNTADINAMPTQVPIPVLSPESIGLKLENGDPGKTVIASISKTEEITDVSYELKYMAKNPDPSSSDQVERGSLGSFDLTKNPVSKEMKLGTCSDVCHYDKGVTDIRIVLKITKEDGKIYQSEAKLNPQEQ